MIKVLIIQGVLPAYREPFFAALGAEPDIDLTVWSDESGATDVPPTQTNRVKTEHRPERRIKGLFSLPGLLEGARTGNFDVLVVPWNTRYIELFPTLLLAKLKGIGTVAWGHGYSKQESAVRLRIRIAAGRLASVIMTYSKVSRDRVVSQGIPNANSFFAPNALDGSQIREAQEYFQANPHRLRDARARDSIPPGPYFVYLARLVQGKGIDFLLVAFSEVVKKRPSARLVLIGDGPERRNIEVLRDTLNLDSSVTLAGAIYGERQLYPWLAEAIALVHPRDIGLSMMHAFNHELPVLTSKDPDRHGPEFCVLKNGHNGLTYKDDDQADLTTKLLELWDSPTRTRELGKNALAQVTGRGSHSMESMVNGAANTIRAAYARANGH